MTVTATHGRESLVVMIASAEKPVITVLTITNVARAKSAVMAIVCHLAVLMHLVLIHLFGAEVLLPPPLSARSCSSRSLFLSWLAAVVRAARFTTVVRRRGQ